MSATNRGAVRRERDAYPTPAWRVEAIILRLIWPDQLSILEPCTLRRGGRKQESIGFEGGTNDMEIQQVKLQYGPLAPSLEQQLNEQGFTLGDQRNFLEKLYYSLNLCGVHILSDKEYAAAKKRLHKKVMEHIKYID